MRCRIVRNRAIAWAPLAVFCGGAHLSAQAGSAPPVAPLPATSISVHIAQNGAGALGSIASTAPQVALKVGNAPLKGSTVTLDLRDSAGVLATDSATTVTDVRGIASFTHLQVRSLANRVYASQITLHMAIRVDGEGTTGDTVIAFALTPPAIATMTLQRLPATAALLVPFDLSALVTSPIGGVPVPVVGARVQLALPDGQSIPATTDASGEADFAAVTIRKAVLGKRDLRLAIATPAAAASGSIVLSAGEVAAVTFGSASASKIAVGKTFTLVVQAHDSFGNPVASRTELSADRTTATFTPPLDTVAIDTVTGVRTWAGTYRGPSGSVQFTARVGNTIGVLNVAASPGGVTQLKVVEDVAGRFVADSILERALVIRVEDAGGNGVSATRVNMALCKLPDLANDSLLTAFNAAVRNVQQGDCSSHFDGITKDARPTPFIRGTQSRISDTSGLARFDSLRIVGPSGRYQFKVTSEACSCVVSSGVMDFNANDAYDRSFAIISAIKSVAGTEPNGEFFDIRFQLRLRPWLHAFVHTDIPITRKSTSDTNVTSPERDVADAEGTLNFSIAKGQVNDRLTEAPDRVPYLGIGMRIFNTVPYFEAHLGNIELAHSMLYGSSLSFGYARVVDNTPVKVGDEIFRPSNHNILIEGFLRSSGIDFFKYLNIRASIMIPLWANGRRPTSRVVIAVPIGGLIPF